MNNGIYTCKSCGQTVDKFSIHHCLGFHPHAAAMCDRMKKVFICSRYRADETHTTEDNVQRALFACAHALTIGCSPIAPHLYIPRCLDDDRPIERALGMAAGRALLAVCDEVWQWGATISEGMAAELAYAKELGITVRVFNSIGIPYKDWNGVKYPDRFPEDAQ